MRGWREKDKMPRPKGSKNKQVVIETPARVALREPYLVDLPDKGIDLSAAILRRIYHPEDYPHDCPSPRDSIDGFLRWLSAHT
jgi:hypothetical protein